MLHIKFPYRTFDPVTQKVKQSNGFKLEIDNRKEQIIKAAIKRFSHFGVAKTTMNEIAEDSSISKGNIYYYFADKNALIAEVVKELLNQFNKVLSKRLINNPSTLEALQQVQDSKKEFLEKYYMLNLFEGLDCPAGNENLKQISDMAKEFGHKIISEILEKGVERGELTIPNIDETTELYLEAIKGISMVNLNLSTKRITIDHELMDSIHHKQMELAKIFVKALSNN